MLVGGGALHAAAEVVDVGGRRSARESPRRFSARPRLPDDCPFVTGPIGLLGLEAELGHDVGMRTRC
jgi:pyruvate dehydrogenase (quinone)